MVHVHLQQQKSKEVLICNFLIKIIQSFQLVNKYKAPEGYFAGVFCWFCLFFFSVGVCEIFWPSLYYISQHTPF